MKITKLVILFNYKKILLGIVISIVLFVLSFLIDSAIIKTLFNIIGGLILLNIIATIVASYLLYDKSDLYEVNKLNEIVDFNNIENAVLINNKIKSEILKEREVGASLTYKALIESINEEFHEKMKYELADIQVVRYENETYRFNILTKKMLEVIKKSKSDLNVLNKMGYKEINTYFNIYELVIQRILNNQNLYTLIHKLLLYKISSIKDLYYPIDSMMNLLRINIKFLEGIGAMEKNNDDIIRIANGSGYYLKKKYREKGTEDKLRGISYRLLNALKTNNTGMFMDTLLNCYLYIQDAVPKIFLEVLKDEDEFKNVGYAFLTGLIDGKVDTGNDNKNNEGGNE